MGVVQAYLPTLDLYRGLLDTTWGLRPYAITVELTSWPSGSVGVGTSTVTTTPLLCDGGNVYARHVSGRQVIASGGLYSAEDYYVGPLTPTYMTDEGQYAGLSPGVLDPPVPTDGSILEVLYRMRGPGMFDSANGDLFRLVAVETWRATRYHITLRKTGEQ